MCHKVTCKFLDVNEGGDFTKEAARANLQIFKINACLLNVDYSE